MAFPANAFADPSQFVTVNGVQVPKQFAGSFNLPAPDATPIGPPPTFAPAELGGPLPTDPTTPVPSVTAPPPPVTLPPAPPLNDNTVNPFPAEQPAPVAPAPAPAKKAAPKTGIEMQQDALAERQRITNEVGDIESKASREQSAIRDQQIIDEDRAEKERAAVRDREQKEVEYARAQQQSAMDAYVNHKVDQGRLWHNSSTGSKIMAGIALAMGALGGAIVARDRGGQVVNPALDIIQKSIDDDVRLQLADRDKLGQVAQMKRTAVGDLLSQFKDKESQYDALRAAQRQRVAMQLDAIAAKTQDPVKKLQAQEASAQLYAQRGVLLDQAQQREIDNRRANRQLSIAGGHLALARSQFDWQKERDKDESAYKWASLGINDRAAAAKAELEKNEKLTELDREQGIGDPSSGDPLKQKDGTVWHAPKERAKELGKQTAAAAQVAHLIDSLKRVRNGAGSEWFNTPEAKKLKGDLAALRLEIKNTAELGVLAGPDMDLIDSFVGTNDATSTDVMNSMMDGLDRARSNTITKVTKQMRTAGFTGDWQPPDESRINKPPLTPEQERLDRTLTTAPGVSPGLINALTPEQERLKKALGPEEGARFERRLLGGYDIKQEHSVNAIANDALRAGPGPERDKYLGQLETIMNNPGTPEELRNYAAEIRYSIGAGTYKPLSDNAARQENVFRKIGDTFKGSKK